MLTNSTVQYFDTTFFKVNLSQNQTKTSIMMKLYTSVVSTNQIKSTYEVLKQKLPTIYEHTCFNDKKLPFSKEVCSTEIGHLFEHIILEYLYQLKTAKGRGQVEIRGETVWDWKKDAWGVFHISINSGIKDNLEMCEAVNKSIKLISHLFESEGLKPHTNHSTTQATPQIQFAT